MVWLSSGIRVKHVEKVDSGAGDDVLFHRAEADTGPVFVKHTPLHD